MGTTTGTYNFNLSLGEAIMEAAGRLEISRGELPQTFMRDGEISANLLLAKWANLEPNLWLVDLQSVNLVMGQATYSVPATTINILDVYITLYPGSPSSQDRVLYGLARTEYAEIPNKTIQGIPTCFWFDRLIAGTITLWSVPNAQSMILNYYRTRRMQDAANANAATVEIPYRWLDAFLSGLAAKLAVKHAPAKAEGLAAEAEMARKIAAEQDVEDVPIYIAPSLTGYYR